MHRGRGWAGLPAGCTHFQPVGRGLLRDYTISNSAKFRLKIEYLSEVILTTSLPADGADAAAAGVQGECVRGGTQAHQGLPPHCLRSHTSFYCVVICCLNKLLVVENVMPHPHISRSNCWKD